MKVIIIKNIKLTMNKLDIFFLFTETKIEFSCNSFGKITICLEGLNNQPIAKPEIIPVTWAI